jgi:hypothetical protein
MEERARTHVDAGEAHELEIDDVVELRRIHDASAGVDVLEDAGVLVGGALRRHPGHEAQQIVADRIGVEDLRSKKTNKNSKKERERGEMK